MSIYYEDVSIGDEVTPMEKLPTEDLAIDYFGRENPTNPAFGDPFGADPTHTTPSLTTDNVGSDSQFLNSFPYLGVPN